jgi:hypothetical protein
MAKYSASPIKTTAIMTIASLALFPLIVIADGAFSPYVNSQGDISLPSNFRTSMVHLGSWFVPEGGASGFHDVYTEKSTVESYKKTGQFPDGATLVKELRSSHAASYTTGNNVSYATNHIKQWFVMIKDRKSRFPNNPLWGDGWGWALYKTEDIGKNLATNYKTDCLGCHIPAKKTGWIYTEAYPTLEQ